jgi:hypothetical protein
MKNGYRVQIAIVGVRENASFLTKAESWAARRETEIRNMKNAHPRNRYTLIDAFKSYVDSISKLIEH